jgi:hypothetical protein
MKNDTIAIAITVTVLYIGSLTLKTRLLNERPTTVTHAHRNQVTDSRAFAPGVSAVPNNKLPEYLKHNTDSIVSHASIKIINPASRIACASSIICLRNIFEQY